MFATNVLRNSLIYRRIYVLATSKIDWLHQCEDAVNSQNGMDRSEST